MKYNNAQRKKEAEKAKQGRKPEQEKRRWKKSLFAHGDYEWQQVCMAAAGGQVMDFRRLFYDTDAAEVFEAYTFKLIYEYSDE